MPDILHSELVIGIVCAVGTESQLVIDLLRERLVLAGYEIKKTIKISQDVIPPLCPELDQQRENKHKRLSDLMDAGNLARTFGPLEGNDAILALGAASEIASLRTANPANGSNTPLPKTAFIIDSLKRPEEVEQLRLIYPSGFVLLGIHSELERRKQYLTDSLGITEQQAAELISRDSEEVKILHGQRVNKTFHLADFFVRITDNHDQLRCDVKRMVELWFGNPFITPTFDEHAMFMAYSSALRSADLSRQVGAVVTRKSQILSTGANECPQAGGGLYWPVRMPNGCIDDVPEGRDYKREDGDSNRAEQVRIIDQIVDLGTKDFQFDPEQLRSLLNKSAIADLTEYGRVVHAEMEALLCCSRNGLSTVGATLYSTTFPCHNCAKHIVAAGVERVVYVEPYAKSKSLQFHTDSIVMDSVQGQNQQKKVVFEPFVGIGPRRFFDLFSMELGSSYSLVRKDKDTGKKREWRIEDSQLRIQMKPISYLELELQALELFNGIVEQNQGGNPNHD